MLRTGVVGDLILKHPTYFDAEVISGLMFNYFVA